MDRLPTPPRFDAICAATPLLLLVHDLQAGRTLYINQGTPAPDAAPDDDPLLARVHPEDRSRVQAWLQRAAAQAEPAPGRREFRLHGADGGWHWFEVHDSVLERGPDGRARQVLGSGHPIDEHKRAESQPVDATPLLQEVEKAPMAVIEFDRDSDRVVRRWAGGAERMFGWTAAEVVGRPLRALDLVHPGDMTGVLAMLQDLLQGRASHVTWTNRNLDRQRRMLHCTWHNSVVPGDGTGPGRIVSLALDISGHQRAEAALLASEQRYRLLAETLLHGVVHQAADGRIIAMNPAAGRILGKTRERFLGSDSVQEEHDTIREDGSPFPGDGHPSMLALRTGELVHGVVMGVWNPERGERRWIRVDAVPILEPGQAQPSEVYTLFEDITERLRTERALREADRHKDLFIATLAHELRNPLAPIQNAAKLLRLQAASHAAQAAGTSDERAANTQRWTGVIERQVAQMARLLDDLLDVSRVARGRLLLRPERLQLSAVIEQAVETARPLIDAAGHSLQVRLPARPVELVGDRVRLAQVCANLLTNAARYTPPGGRIEVVGEHDDPSGQVLIRVRDNGIGLASEHLLSVFEMFGQVQTAAERSQGGMGIGLALSRGLVQMHGGSISAHSAGPGQGSEFVVRLPSGGVPQPAAAPAQAPAAAAGPRPRRVLVADDNTDAAQTLALLLSAQGHEVRTAADGVEALALAEAWPPEVALLDLGMPRMDGHALCRALRARPGGERLLVVAVSGWGQEQDRARSAEAGFDAHLVKPVQDEELAHLLARHPRLAPAAQGVQAG